MKRLIEFKLPDSEDTILIECNSDADANLEYHNRLFSKAGDFLVAKSEASLKKMLIPLVKLPEFIISNINDMESKKPDEFEITMKCGFSATGKIYIADATGEASVEVKMKWNGF
ncbi:MAG: CU044_2847 family protein [Bacteroidota bacterium]